MIIIIPAYIHYLCKILYKLGFRRLSKKILSEASDKAERNGKIILNELDIINEKERNKK